MTILHTNKLVQDYLRRLEQAAAQLPRARQAELVVEIREHIDDALLEAGAADEVAVRNVLERLGPPEEIAAAAGPVQRRSGRFELAAMIALAVLFLGWFVGIVLVAASRAWTGREKAVGIALVLVPAVVFALALMAAGGPSGTEVEVGTPFEDQESGDDGGVGPIELVVIFGTLFAGPLAAVYLGTRLRRQSDTTEVASARGGERGLTASR